MKKLRFAILHALAQSGRAPISDIITSAGLAAYTESQLVAATKHLEALGLIRPHWGGKFSEVTAEVTPFGKEVLVAVF